MADEIVVNVVDVGVVGVAAAVVVAAGAILAEVAGAATGSVLDTVQRKRGRIRY